MYFIARSSRIGARQAPSRLCRSQRPILDILPQRVSSPGARSSRLFLRIMRGFERTPQKRRLYEGVLRDGRYPVQIVWGANDPALKLAVHGEIARRAAGLDEILTVPAKHFLQEDQAPAVAQYVADLAAGG
jgi:pimeloyl-ACP methyl ester carboxylesterase